MTYWKNSAPYFAMLVSLGLILIVASSFFGLLPITPESHKLLENMVVEYPILNNEYYEILSGQVYISQIDLERLYITWEMR